MNRILLAAAALLLSLAYGAELVAQTGTLMTLPGHNSTYNGNTRGYWFTAPTDFIISGIRVPDNAGSGNQTFEVVRLQAAPPNYSTTTNAFTSLVYQRDISPGFFATNIAVSQGDVIGILGVRGTNQNSYGSGNFQTTILGQNVTLARLGFQAYLTQGQARDLWTESGGSISRVEMYYIAPGPSLNVTATAGTAQTVYANAQGTNNDGISIGTFEIECTNQNNGELTEIELEASGSMDASTDISEIKVYRDDNANMQFDPGTDVEIGTGSAFTGANGTSTVTVSGAEQDFAQNQTNTYFVVAKLNGMASPGETLDITLSDISVGTNTQKAGVPATTMSGLIIDTPGFTLTDLSSSNVSDAILGTNDNLMQVFTVEYPAGPDNTLTTFDVQASGTGDDSAAYAALKLYLDDGDMAFDASLDTNVASETFMSDDGTLQLTLSGAESMYSAGETKMFFLVADFNLMANHGDTFATQVTAAGGEVTGTTLTALPLPATGPAAGVTILGNVLLTQMNGPAMGDVVNNDHDFPGMLLLDFTISTTNVDWTLDGLVFRAGGTGDDASAFDSLTIYEDLDQDGLFNPAFELPAGPAGTAFDSDDGTWIGTLQNAVITSSAAPRRFFLVGTLAGTAREGQTFNATLEMINATPPLNGIFIGLPTASGPDYTIDAASLNVAFNGPGSATAVSGTATAQMLLDVTLDSANEQFTLTEMTFTASGSGNDASAFSELALYEDDGDGVYSFANDTLATAFTGAGFSADNGDYVATLSDSNFNGPSSRRFFLIATLNGTALSGETFNAGLSAINVTSQSSTAPTGLPSMLSTALIIDNPVLTIASSMLDAPQDTVVEKTGADFSFMLAKLEMSASNGDIDVSGMRINLTGTGDWVNDVDPAKGVQLYLDDGDTIFDELSDTLISEVGGSLGALNFPLTPSLMVANGAKHTFFMRVNVLGSAGGSTPSTFVASMSSPTNVDVATGISVLLGSPAPTSATLTLIEYFISDVTPKRVPVGSSGQDITIIGSGFTPPVSLTIDGVRAPGGAIVSPDGTMITGLMVPDHLGKNLEVVLSTGLLGPRTYHLTFSYSDADGGGGGGAGCAMSESSSSNSLWIMVGLVLGAGVMILRRKRLDACESLA